MAAAALKGKGLEPLLDSIADFLPSPLDRNPPALHRLNARGQTVDADKQSKTGDFTSEGKLTKITRGHPLHKSSLALAFKVVHMKGRGSGDGRVVFARIYSGKLRDRDQLTVSIVSLFMFDACTVFESTYLEVEEWFCRPIFFCTIRITPLFSA
jgi:elongation factor G